MSLILDKYGKPFIQPKSVASATRVVKNPRAIIDKIVKMFKDTSRKDIDRWRSAVKLAELPDKPRRDMLYNLYHDLLTDGHLQSLITLRKGVVLNTEFQIINNSNGDVDIDKTRFFKSKWFYDILDILAETSLYGYSLVEFLEFSEKSIKTNLILRTNVVPEFKRIIADFQKPEDYLVYDKEVNIDWLFEFGKGDLGLLNTIVPNLIWKRNMMQSWAEFCEKFGIPMITATSQRYDEETLDLIEDMLTQLGEAAYATFPQGTEIDIKESNRSDVYKVFDAKINRNNNEMSKALLSGTMMVDEGSSRAQSEVHERNLNEIIAPVERRNIQFLVNDVIIPILILHGYDLNEDDSFAFDTSQELTLKEHWDITSGILANFDVDETWISKTFNVPITGKKVSAAPVQENAKIGAIAHLDSGFVSSLLSRGILLPAYDGTPCCSAHDIFTPNSAYNSEINELHEQLFESYWNNKSTLPQESRIIALEALRLLSALRSGWGERAVQVAYNEPDLLALSLMEYNLFEFSASKTEARLAAMSQLMIDKDKLQIRSFNDFKREAFRVTNSFNTNYLRTEYNSSVAIGQNGAAFYRAMSEADTIPYVQYLTVGDSNVRNSHQILDRKIFNLKDTEARRVWPPNDYGCRCTMIQYPYKPDSKNVTKGREAVEQLGGNKFKNSPFGINRGDTMQVFTQDQFYHHIKNLPDKINDMNYKDTYGLKPYSDLKNSLSTIKLDKTITKDNLTELFKIDGKIKNDEFMGFSDYLKRKLIVRKSTFDEHTTGKYLAANELRHQMFPHIQNVLNKPDEVWMHEYKNQKGKFQSRYIKFYKDMAFVVDAELGNNNLEIKSWYQLKAKEKEIRKGLLL